MIKSRKIGAIVSILSFSIWLFSCSDDGDSDDAFSLNDIEGTWNCYDNNSDICVFQNDGKGYFFIDGTKEAFTWSFAGNVLLFKSEDWDSDYNTEVHLNDSKLFFDYIDHTFYKTYYPVQDDDNDENSDSASNFGSNSDYDPNLIGEWWYGDVLKSLNQYYFCKNGVGYRISSVNGKDYGVKYFSFSWNTKEIGKLEIHYEGSSSSTIYDYEIDGKNLVVETNGFTYNWRRMGDEVDENFDTGKLPFNNYLKNKNSGYYYAITKMASGCNHAGTGDNMNDQFLHFFGSDGSLTTTGLRIVYYTPRWEGIDSYWYSGSYTMNSASGAYRYVAMAWCNGVSLDTYQGGTLKISRSGSFTTYDFNDKEVELHVLVESN